MIRYTYCIFATPTGKGYGCFGISHEKDSRIYTVAPCFCHPHDRSKFSKKHAREVAKNRLNSDSWGIEVESDINSYEKIIKDVIEFHPKAPSWAKRALKNGHFSHTLVDDSFTNKQLMTKNWRKNERI